MRLKENSTLREGKYKIEKFLGQGGFSNTYLAEQNITVKGGIGTISTKIKVAIKEFFMKDLCNRDADTSYVSVPSIGSKDLVEKFKAKFIKEAQNIAQLNHNHIIKVLDVFEENGTAYYVMEYIENGSLDDRIAKYGAMSEKEAVHYIYQISEALKYIHAKRINHLDVKPSNVLLKQGGESILIDFGLAKRYDESGSQTSSTPVGISKGYAPMEQYNQGGVSSFSAATDIYSLGATLYKLVTGSTPPNANEIYEEGIPELPAELSPSVKLSIAAAMKPRRKDRPGSVDEFLTILGKEEVSDETVIHQQLIQQSTHEKLSTQISYSKEKDTVASYGKNKFNIIIGIAVLLLLCIGGGFYFLKSDSADFFLSSQSLNDSEFVEDVIISDTTKNSNNEQQLAEEQRKLASLQIIYPTVCISGGTFKMGSNDEEAESEEQPIHIVTVASYHLGRCEVTQQQWQDMMGNNPSLYKISNKPVTNVTWYDCIEFCNALSRKAGLKECYEINDKEVRVNMVNNGYRLPTEVEWEYAARGGAKSKNYKYSGSNKYSDVAWCSDNSELMTHSIGFLEPNELGLYDMSGNVFEWCWDQYIKYSRDYQKNFSTVMSGSIRTIRGGCCYSTARFCRSTYRNSLTPANSNNFIGLRLARSC